MSAQKAHKSIPAEAFKPAPTRLPTTSDAAKRTLEKTSPRKFKAIIDDLKAGKHTVAEIALRRHVSHHTVTAVRHKVEDEDPEFNVQRWRKRTANTLAHFASRGAERLVDEVDRIPVGQLPVAVAIAADKTLALMGDIPAPVVEKRLLITHEEINALILNCNPPSNKHEEAKLV